MYLEIKLFIKYIFKYFYFLAYPPFTVSQIILPYVFFSILNTIIFIFQTVDILYCMDFNNIGIQNIL